MTVSSTAVSALSPIVALAVNCAVHVTLSVACGPAYPYRSIVRASLGGLFVVVGINLSLPRLTSETLADAIASAILNVTTYAALAFGYFSFVNLCLTSLRIRILRELWDAGGSLPLVSLQALYGNDDLVAVRVQRLIAGGHLIERDNTFYSVPGRFLLIARLFDFLRWFVLGGPRGDIA